MSGAGGMDVRVPIGGLFTILGLIVAGYGVATASDTALYAKSEAVNINLWWGLVMVAFGLVMLALARRGRSTVEPASASPEGRDTEKREHVLGIEGSES